MSPGRRQLPAEVTHAAQEADAIIHLGDFTHPSVADALEAIAPLYAVHGNNDPPALQERFPPCDFLTIHGHRFALIHGHIGGKTAVEAARIVPAVDVVLFGHSHYPRILHEHGRLLFNPGSPTDRRFAPHAAYGIIDVGDTVDARLISL